jgi:hypothetical protein
MLGRPRSVVVCPVVRYNVRLARWVCWMVLARSALASLERSTGAPVAEVPLKHQRHTGTGTGKNEGICEGSAARARNQTPWRSWRALAAWRLKFQRRGQARFAGFERRGETHAVQSRRAKKSRPGSRDACGCRPGGGCTLTNLLGGPVGAPAASWHARASFEKRSEYGRSRSPVSPG